MGPQFVKFLIVVLLSLWSKACGAQVQIAFIEMKDAQGQTVQLEPGGHFAHIAISYRGRWLHAHPYRGVELITSAQLEKIGRVVKMTLTSRSELTAEELVTYEGRPYDPTFSWTDDSYYCSQLIAKILQIEPLPMNFRAPLWQGRKKQQGWGLSPDDIYRILQQAPRCEKIF